MRSAEELPVFAVLRVAYGSMAGVRSAELKKKGKQNEGTQ
jgi:hypothetical protein